MLNFIYTTLLLIYPLAILYIFDKRGNSKVNMINLLALTLPYFIAVAVLNAVFPFSPYWFIGLEVILILMLIGIGWADKTVLLLSILIVPVYLIALLLGFATMLLMFDKNDKISKHIDAQHKLFAPYLMVSLGIIIILAFSYGVVMNYTYKQPIGYKPLCVSVSNNGLNDTIGCLNNTSFNNLNISNITYIKGIPYEAIYGNQTSPLQIFVNNSG